MFKNVKLVFMFSVILTINRNYLTVHILVKTFFWNNSHIFKFSLEVIKQIIGRVMILICTNEIKEIKTILLVQFLWKNIYTPTLR